DIEKRAQCGRRPDPSRSIAARHVELRGITAQALHERVVLSGGPDRNPHVILEPVHRGVRDANALRIEEPHEVLAIRMPDQDKIAKALRDVESKLHCRDSNLFPILRDERGVLAEEWIPYNGTNGFERNNTHVAEPLPILDRHHVRSAAKQKS